MAVVGFIVSALFLAMPAFFCVVPLNYFATRLSVWLRALIAAIIPAGLFTPFSYMTASGDPPMTEAERVAAAASLAGVQFLVGFIAAFLSARRHPVPEQEVEKK